MIEQQVVSKPINKNVNDKRNIYAFRAWADEMGLHRMISEQDDETLHKCYLRWMDSDGEFFAE